MKFIILSFLISFTAFAQDIGEVNSGEMISANKFNELVLKINDLQKKGLQQVVQQESIDPHVYNMPSTRSSAGVIDALNISITTAVENSDILYSANITYESYHDMMFFLERKIDDGVYEEIGSGDNTNIGSRAYGLFSADYDGGSGNEASTMISSHIEYLDDLSLPVGSVVSYRLRVYSATGNRNFYLNRTLNDGNSSAHERGSSRTLLKEIGQ